MFAEFFNKYLVNDWKNAPKWLSMWVFAIIAASPDVYALAVQYGILETGALPEVFKLLINWVGFIGAVSRIIDQKAIVDKLRGAKEEA